MGSICLPKEAQDLPQSEDAVSSGRCLQVRFIATRDLVNRCKEVWFGWVSLEMVPAWADLSILVCFPFLTCKKNSWEGKREMALLEAPRYGAAAVRCWQ